MVMRGHMIPNSKKVVTSPSVVRFRLIYIMLCSKTLSFEVIRDQ